MLEIRPFSPDDEFFLALTRAAPDRSPAAEARADEIIGLVRGGAFSLADAAVTVDELSDARDQAPEQFLAALSLARVNLRKFHEYQRRQGYRHDDGEGVLLSRRALPVASVGICCGTSPLELLACAVPAQAAGTGRIAVAVAPGPDGRVNPPLLAAARMLALGEVYRLDRDLAPAALALGADPVAGVKKVVGRTGAAGMAAGRRLAGRIGFALVGPGEDSLAIIADRGANARLLAADLLARNSGGRADEAGAALLFTDDRLLAEAVRIEVARGLDRTGDPAAAAASLGRACALFLCASLAEAVQAANAMAPARLALLTRDNHEWLPEVENAGLVLCGPWCPEHLGLPFSGANTHPPAGSAAFASGLGVDDFLKETTVVEYSPERLLKTGRRLLSLAEAAGAGGEAAGERLDLLRSGGYHAGVD